MLGFMEQTCAELLSQAFTAVGLRRPKYPYQSCTRSALNYIALYLKANNPKCVLSEQIS